MSLFKTDTSKKSWIRKNEALFFLVKNEVIVFERRVMPSQEVGWNLKSIHFPEHWDSFKIEEGRRWAASWGFPSRKIRRSELI